METTILDVQVCPYCGHEVDAHSGSEGTPEAGDLSICFYCGEVATYSEHLSLMKVTEEQLSELDDDLREAIVKIQESVKKYNK